MDDKNESDLPMVEKNVLFYLFILIGAVSLLLSFFSCSSQNPVDSSRSRETADSTDIESVKIKGVMISVGDGADTVYSQIGKGILTVATNDPADQNSIIILRSYVSEDKTYRISFCKANKGYYHVCRISLLKLPLKRGVGAQSEVEPNLDAERHRPRNGIDSNQSEPRIITNDDLKKMDRKNK
jgi:hypothetical protein